jgi:hypothetical protein
MLEADHQQVLRTRQSSLDSQPLSRHPQPGAGGFSARTGQPIELCDRLAEVAASERDLGGS